MITRSAAVDIAAGVVLVAIAIFVIDAASAGLSNRLPWYTIFMQWKSQVTSPLYITLVVGAVVVEKYVTTATWLRKLRGDK